MPACGSGSCDQADLKAPRQGLWQGPGFGSLQQYAVVDIACSGDVLPLDCETPPFDSKDDKRGLIPEDGQMFRDRSYDELKKERLKGRVAW